MILKITRYRCFILIFCLLQAHMPAFAQSVAAAVPEMAEGLRSSGKIYVVVLVLATIFAGIIAFLIYLERRLNRLERDVKNPA